MRRRSCRAVRLGRVCPRRPFLTVPTGDLQKRPPPPVHHIPRSPWVNSMDECLNMADSSPSLEDDEALADSQEHPGRVAVVHTKQYAVEKAWDLLMGVFSSMFLCGQHDSVPTLSASRMPRSSTILKVVSTKGRATLSFVLAQPFLIIWSFLTGYLSTQSRKEIQISALQESSQSKSKSMRAKKKKDLITLGKGEGSAKQEKDSPVTKRPSGQGKDSDGDVSAPSAFGRLIVNNVLSSFIPRPGPLGRDIYFKNLAKSCLKKSQVAFKSSYKRNAIASSYSSTLAQWPPERIYARDTRAAVPGTTLGTATGAAARAHATGGAAPGAALCAAAGATQSAAPGAVSWAATGDAAHATRGAVPDAAADATRAAAAGATQGAAAPGAVSWAATGDAARATRGAVPGADSGAAPVADSGAAADAAPGAAADAAPGGASGAAADAAPGGASGAAPGAASGAAADALPLPSPASSRSKRAAKKGREKGRSASSDPIPGAALPLPSSTSSRSKGAPKKGSEKGPEAPGNSKKKEKKKRKAKKAAITDDPQVKQEDPRNGLPAPDIPKPVRRKIPLLLPHRRDAPLILPPPLELCFRITAEDFDLEKKTAMQWINRVLRDDGAKARCN
nr:putative POM121-like protein 1 [Peromyscus maniculatus bairdii]